MTRLDDLNLDPVRPSQTGPKRVIVMQGISGSGKSVLARKLAEAERRPGRPGGYVVSADDYFYRLGGGVYKYEFSKIGEAHDECFRNFICSHERKPRPLGRGGSESASSWVGEEIVLQDLT
jgi:hypothetical protein